LLVEVAVIFSSDAADDTRVRFLMDYGVWHL